MSVDVMKMRRELVARHVDVGGKSVLEIGAFDRPLYKAPEVELSVLDYLNTDDLISLARRSEGRDPDNIPTVNYIAKSHLVSQDVDRSFDLIVCNYVIEHIPNFIEWMCDIRKLLNPGGRLLFSLPDRNYTYDYLRHETTAVDLLRAYSESQGKPDFWQILDAIYYYRPITGVEGWHPEVLQQRLQAKTLTLMEALSVAKAQSALPYKDTHCSVFTRESFIALFAELKVAGLLPFNLDEVTEVERGTFEFQGILSLDENFSGLPHEVQALRGLPGLSEMVVQSRAFQHLASIRLMLRKLCNQS